MAAGRRPDGRGGPHVFVDDLDGPVLSEADEHHLTRVLRVRVGDPLTLGDGLGRWRPARYGAELELLGSIQHVERTIPEITVAMTPVKGDRTATAVQKLTELGVDRIIMFESSRSVVRWDRDRAVKAIARLEAVARSAAAQSRQLWLPSVEGPESMASMLARDGVAAAERGGSAVDLAYPCVLIGPEGGWAEGELAEDLPRVGLSQSVLRAETAAISVGVLLTALREGLVSSHSE